MIAPGARARRLFALCRKETLQIVRDPSTLLIAGLFPVVLLFIFGAGINLDSAVVPVGVVLEDDGEAARRFVDTLAGSPSFRVLREPTVTKMADRLRAGEVRGFVVVRADFSRRFRRGDLSTPTALLVTDGAEPNTASFAAAYVRGAYGRWLREEARRQGGATSTGFTLESRVWFNPSAKSRNSLLPGSITIIMSVVCALLTALVVAREWERGTMEALLAAGISRFELIACKLIPYFFLGMAAFTISVLLTVHVFGVPLRGSIAALLFVTSVFLGSALGMGLLLSTALRNQYDAAQAALNVAFLPALMLSGFVFEIAAMPRPIRLVSTVIPARFFLSAIETLFQAGDVWSVLLRSLLGLGLATLGFLGLTLLITRTRLE